MRVIFVLLLFVGGVRAAVLVNTSDFYLEVTGVTTSPTFALDNQPFAEFSYATGGDFEINPNQPLAFSVPPSYTLGDLVVNVTNFYENFGLTVVASTPFPSRIFSESALLQGGNAGESPLIQFLQDEKVSARSAALQGFQHTFTGILPLFLLVLIYRYYRVLGRANGTF